MSLDSRVGKGFVFHRARIRLAGEVPLEVRREDDAGHGCTNRDGRSPWARREDTAMASGPQSQLAGRNTGGGCPVCADHHGRRQPLWWLVP